MELATFSVSVRRPTMRKTMLVLSVLAVAACARAGDDDAMMADSPATAAVPTPVSYADFAGRWSIQLLGDMSDSVIATYELSATADGSNWTLTPSGGTPISVRTAIDADSILIDAGPYKMKSAGPDVTTHAVGRLEAGMLIGTFKALHAVTTADSVMHGRLHGTRMP
jgi:hypothetical protein